jgi:hypothetical protein
MHAVTGTITVAKIPMPACFLFIMTLDKYQHARALPPGVQGEWQQHRTHTGAGYQYCTVSDGTSTVHYACNSRLVQLFCPRYCA